MFNNFSFPKIAPFMRQCRKIWWSQRVHKWRHNIAHTRCMLNKQGYMHAHTRVRAHARKRARIHTHTHEYVIFTFSTAKMIREIVSMLRYTYIFFVFTQCCYSYQHHNGMNQDKKSKLSFSVRHDKDPRPWLSNVQHSRVMTTWGTPNSSRQVVRLTEGNTHWNPLLASIHRIGPEISVT
jgi:hypothetical protein